MTEQIDGKKELRAWLYQLLAKIELSQGIKAEKTEKTEPIGSQVILNISFIE